MENLIEFQVYDKAKFDDIADMDRLIFLGGYQAEPAEQQVSGKNSTKKSKKVSNFGFVFSTKRLLTNFVAALSLHVDTGVCTGFDRNFSLCKKGWVLGNFGSVSTSYCLEDRQYGSTYNLFGVCLMKSETIDGFQNFCLVFGRALNLFFNALLVIRSFSIDHSDAISKGVLSFSPRAQLLSCWPHLRRKCQEKKIVK